LLHVVQVCLAAFLGSFGCIAHVVFILSRASARPEAAAATFVERAGGANSPYRQAMGDLADVVGPLGSSEGNPNHAFLVVRDHGIGLDRFPGYTTHSGSDRCARPRTQSACSGVHALLLSSSVTTSALPSPRTVRTRWLWLLVSDEQGAVSRGAVLTIAKAR
jgi:hypothetical protein